MGRFFCQTLISTLFAFLLVASARAAVDVAPSAPSFFEQTAFNIRMWTANILYSLLIERYLNNHPDVKSLETYAQAWDAADIEGIVAPFPETGFIFRDALSQEGIRDKTALRKYVRDIFKRYPKEVWTRDLQLFQSLTRPREYVAYYKYAMFLSKTAPTPKVTGSGLEHFQFDSTGHLVADEIHLIFNELDASSFLKIPRPSMKLAPTKSARSNQKP